MVKGRIPFDIVNTFCKKLNPWIWLCMLVYVTGFIMKLSIFTLSNHLRQYQPMPRNYIQKRNYFYRSSLISAT